MAKVRVREGSSLLFVDFYYQGVRCREQTALTDSAQNRKRVQALADRVEREIRAGTFDYGAIFPASPKAARFAQAPGAPRLEVPTAPVPTASIPTARAVAVDVATPTLGEFSIVWRAEMMPQWRPLHARSVDAIFTAHLLPAFGARPIAAISKADVLAFRANLAKLPGRGNERLAPTTVNKVFGILRQCLTEACDRYDLPDPFKAVKRIKARRSDVEPFSLEEVEQIRTHIRKDWREYVTVRFFTGMRTGEINGLKWKYVDFEHGLIRIRETYSAGLSMEGAKTETSVRDIPMLPQVEHALRQRWENRHPDSEYVFCNREGQPVDAHNFATRIWYPLLRYLELTPRRPYQTRHTTATLMLASGENPEWIARLMGHANTQMLFTVYSRFVPNLTRQDGRAFTGLINSRVGTPNALPPEPASTPAPAAKLSALSRAQLETLVRSLTAGHEQTPALENTDERV